MQLVDGDHKRSTRAAGSRNCAFLSIVTTPDDDRTTCARRCAARALQYSLDIMKNKKTLKLSLETIRRLDLDAAQGGYYHPHRPTHGCPPTRSLGFTCGFGCWAS